MSASRSHADPSISPEGVLHFGQCNRPRPPPSISVMQAGQSRASHPSCWHSARRVYAWLQALQLAAAPSRTFHVGTMAPIAGDAKQWPGLFIIPRWLWPQLPPPPLDGWLHVGGRAPPRPFYAVVARGQLPPHALGARHAKRQWSPLRRRPRGGIARAFSPRSRQPASARRSLVGAPACMRNCNRAELPPSLQETSLAASEYSPSRQPSDERRTGRL